MTSSTDGKLQSKGPQAYQHALRYQNQEKPIGSTEYQLYTDAHIVDDLDASPFCFINTCVLPSSIKEIQPALVLRINDYAFEYEPLQEPIPTDVSSYHGGFIQDELAAMLSLLLGCRMKAGNITRQFSETGDPRGRPIFLDLSQNPIRPSFRVEKMRLPFLLEQKDLKKGILLSTLHKWDPLGAATLIKAARLYQDAVWIGESEPELAWLLLTSAVETAAGFWKIENDPPVDRLLDSRPKLGELLEAAGGKELLQKVAEEMADYMGATKKFTGFLTIFCPSSPSARTHPAMQLEWNERSLRKALQKVYSWRSRALHGGTPFPPNMSEPPLYFDEIGYAEKPMGLGTKMAEGVWHVKDTPMLLHTFEYIVRGSLINWWSSRVK